jgi:antitoxin ChpS
MMDPKPRPRYTIQQLLDISDYSQPMPPEEREWVDAPPVGNEPLGPLRSINRTTIDPKM